MAAPCLVAAPDLIRLPHFMGIEENDDKDRPERQWSLRPRLVC